MKILFVNKFLHPNGGSETYIFKLGEEFIKEGHEAEYFGMEHEGRIVGNSAEAYTSDMDLRKGSKLGYAFKTVYSREARKKIRKVLDKFSPDVVHLNNFNYQLTPSVILEVAKWRKKTGRKCAVVYTAHDYQLVCPNHMLFCPSEGKVCERCLSGKFKHCVKGRCIHGSKLKSMVGAFEGWFWKKKKTYRLIDAVVCPSEFMRSKLSANALLRDKTRVMHNFVRPPLDKSGEKGDYVLYFGRLSEEKGIETLCKACEELPHIQFVFAGGGPLEERVKSVKNVRFVGFKSGEELEELIKGARFSVYPSEWYENCPFSVMESRSYLTPVIGARIGGIPELISEGGTGDLFESGNAQDLKEKISALWNDAERNARYIENCKNRAFYTTAEYCGELLSVYSEVLNG